VQIGRRKENCLALEEGSSPPRGNPNCRQTGRSRSAKVHSIFQSIWKRKCSRHGKARWDGSRLQNGKRASLPGAPRLLELKRFGKESGCMFGRNNRLAKNLSRGIGRHSRKAPTTREKQMAGASRSKAKKTKEKFWKGSSSNRLKRHQALVWSSTKLSRVEWKRVI